MHKLYTGDCQKVLRKNVGDNSVQLIVTSPPYADRRIRTYGGIPHDRYVEWFLQRSEEFLRVLTESGTFILNIKEGVVDGERSTYVLDLIIGLRAQGWFWTEEFIWHKKNSHPGKWPNRFRDSWERILQFNKNKKFDMYQEEVMVPMGDWAKSRLKNLSATDKVRDNSRVGSGFGKNVSKWEGRTMAYPNNVLHMATECYNRNHSATFPLDLPTWFIKLFSRAGETVLDPFMGAGTTIVAAERLGRDAVGIDIQKEYKRIVLDRLAADKAIKSGEKNGKSIK